MTTPYKCGMIDGIQMMPDEVSYVVEKIRSMPQDGKMVEWGSGGSTCKWLKELSPSQRLISIEHNKQWYDNVVTSVRVGFGKLPSNFTYMFRPEHPCCSHGYGGVEEENPAGLDGYIFPTSDVLDANLYLVDGLARGPIVSMLMFKNVKKDATILLHDFTHRQVAYNWITQFCEVEIIGDTLAKLSLK